MVDTHEVEKFFFKAMAGGWSEDGDKLVIPNLPGYKAIPFRSGDLYLLDWYCVTPYNSKSAGTTTIWFRDVPVWTMNYGGFYEERAIPFLKEALNQTCETRQFVGGRGPLLFVQHPLLYVNKPHLNDFSRFEGREEIFDIEIEKSLGYHEYWGLSLL